MKFNGARNFILRLFDWPSAAADSFWGDFCTSQSLPSSSFCKWRRSAPPTWPTGSRPVDQSASLCGARDWWYTPAAADEWEKLLGIPEYDVIVTSSHAAGVLAGRQDMEECGEAGWRRRWLNDDVIATQRFAPGCAGSKDNTSLAHVPLLN